MMQTGYILDTKSMFYVPLCPTAT